MHGTISLNRQNIAINHKKDDCIPPSLLIGSLNQHLNLQQVFFQEPIVLAGTYVLFVAREQTTTECPIGFTSRDRQAPSLRALSVLLR